MSSSMISIRLCRYRAMFGPSSSLLPWSPVSFDLSAALNVLLNILTTRVPTSVNAERRNEVGHATNRYGDRYLAQRRARLEFPSVSIQPNHSTAGWRLLLRNLGSKTPWIEVRRRQPRQSGSCEIFVTAQLGEAWALSPRRPATLSLVFTLTGSTPSQTRLLASMCHQAAFAYSATIWHPSVEMKSATSSLPVSRRVPVSLPLLQSATFFCHLFTSY